MRVLKNLISKENSLDFQEKARSLTVNNSSCWVLNYDTLKGENVDQAQALSI